MNIRIIAALIIVIALSASHRGVYVAGKNAHRNEILNQTIAANEDAREQERLNRQSKESALENRTKAILLDAAASSRARDAAIRLHDASNRSLQAAREDHAACVVSAATHAELLGRCEQSYRGMAGKAQGHVNDIKAMITAWPK